jgi:5-bromo-4-chloroindolyl phosphate hydrolysis protein
MFLCECWVTTILSLAALIGIYYLLWKNIKNGHSKKLERVEEFEKLMQEAGIVHNEGLEYVYEELEQRAESIGDIISTIVSSTIRFIKCHPFFQSNLENATELAEIMIEKLKNTDKSDDCLWNNGEDVSLSDSQKKHLKYKYSKISIYDDVNKIIKVLDTIKHLDFKNGNEEDRYIVIASVEIAKASSSYWEANSSKWKKLFNKFGEWFNKGKKVVISDIDGGILGAFQIGIMGDTNKVAANIALAALLSSAWSAGKQITSR